MADVHGLLRCSGSSLAVRWKAHQQREYLQILPHTIPAKGGWKEGKTEDSPHFWIKAIGPQEKQKSHRASRKEQLYYVGTECCCIGHCTINSINRFLKMLVEKVQRTVSKTV